MEKAIKKRLVRAKERAILDLKRIGYKIVPSDNSSFCIIGMRKNETRFIRIVIDKITDEDIKKVQDYPMSPSCIKEIWCKKIGQQSYEIKEIF
ncbi:MAG: hypothetical protein JSV96_15165 [Candidatus Aminicenantes bacterium]|nr:MAG: hypothetical protein JSV96_15165 [Candidatus Aminicenantes bacterium]